MTLAELTDRNAVLEAINEFDALGQPEFLERHGFGPAREYFLEYNGGRYDSKAIVGVAHGYQHGEQLRASDFSGGEDTVMAKLRALGFDVVRAESGWHYLEGDVTTRTDIQKRYGGTIFGGIEPSRTSPNIIIYTDPETGALNGYDYDGWDGADPNVFYYTGEGRKGDQEMREGNRAILEQEQSNRTIRLFESLDKKQRPGGKRQQYVGAFYLDPATPYRMAPAPDAEGNPRQVIVFRLIREGAALLATIPQPPGANAGAVGGTSGTGGAGTAGGDAGQSQDPHEVKTTETDEGDKPSAEVTAVPSETNTVTEYELMPRAGAVAQRAEGKLVTQFEGWLRSQKHQVERLRIRIPGERNELITDTYDSTDKVLYEAKSGSDRATIRLGIGQILDYLRFLPDVRGRLLLPDEPSQDLKALITACGLSYTYRRLGSWVTNE